MSQRTVTTIALMLVFAAPAYAQEVPWSQLPNVESTTLTQDVKTKATELMKAHNCYFGCSGTIFACVTKADPVPSALFAAGFIARQVARGKPGKDIARDLMDRAKSVHPFKTVELDLSTAVCLGDPKAPVVVAAFTDFECPFCRMVSPVLKEAADKDPRVTYCFKFFPVKGHGPLAVHTSKLGAAAESLGKFWGLHDVMYQNFEKHSDADIEGYAKELGLDWGAVQKAAATKEIKDRVVASKREGLKLGVKSTPTVYVNGKLYTGEKSQVELIDRIDEELALTR
jgi:protein-disulfide isomerase